MARAATAQRRTTRSPRRRTVRRARPSSQTRRSQVPSPRSRSQAARRGSAGGDAAIQRFLDGFTRDLTAGDGRGVAARFEYPVQMVMSAVGGHGGNQLLGDEGTVAEFFDKAPEQYHAKGIEQTIADIEGVEWVAHDLALVRVHFPYVDPDGNDMGDGETSLYLLRKTGRGFAICTAITLGTDGDRAARHGPSPREVQQERRNR